MPDEELISQAPCKCPKCGAKLRVTEKKVCLAEPIKAQYELQVSLEIEPQGDLGFDNTPPLEEAKPKKPKKPKKDAKTKKGGKKTRKNAAN